MPDVAWIEIEESDGRMFICILGELDASNVDKVSESLDAVTSSDEPCHYIDLTRATYFDSSGIRLLFALAERLRLRRSGLEVIAPSDGLVRRVLELTDLARIVRMHESRREALSM